MVKLSVMQKSKNSEREIDTAEQAKDLVDDNKT